MEDKNRVKQVRKLHNGDLEITLHNGDTFVINKNDELFQTFVVWTILESGRAEHEHHP